MSGNTLTEASISGVGPSSDLVCSSSMVLFRRRGFVITRGETSQSKEVRHGVMGRAKDPKRLLESQATPHALLARRPRREAAQCASRHVMAVRS